MTRWPWRSICQASKTGAGDSGGTGRTLQVGQRVVVLGPRLLHVGEPVRVVVLGRALERVLERPRLAPVGPVVGVEAMGLAEVRPGALDVARAVEVLTEGEVRRGLGQRRRAGPG